MAGSSLASSEGEALVLESPLSGSSSMNSSAAETVLFIQTLAAVTSGLLTIVKTGVTIVSYFGNVTASLFALTIVRKFTPR